MFGFNIEDFVSEEDFQVALNGNYRLMAMGCHSLDYKGALKVCPPPIVQDKEDVFLHLSFCIKKDDEIIVLGCSKSSKQQYMSFIQDTDLDYQLRLMDILFEKSNITFTKEIMCKCMENEDFVIEHGTKYDFTNEEIFENKILAFIKEE